VLAQQNDPWGAARYYAEAEKQEELEENKAADIKVWPETLYPSDSSATQECDQAPVLQAALYSMQRTCRTTSNFQLSVSNAAWLCPPQAAVVLGLWLQVGDDTMVNDKNSATITTNASGFIQMANKVLTQMLG
jgi:hypothetical protein